MGIKKINIQVFSFIVLLFSIGITGQEKISKQENRKIHYAPDGDAFVLKNGTRKFNRALYGSNTGFRVEAGDLPEFAMYMPGMGGNFKLGLSNGKKSKWVSEASKIETRYVLGTMRYKIEDPILEKGALFIELVALKEKEGLVLKVYGNNLPKNIELIWAYGGATGKKFSREGDIGADPESVFYLQPDYCIGNKYVVQKQSFSLNYGSESNKEKTGNNKRLFGFFPESQTHLANAKKQNSPLELYNSVLESLTVITGKLNLVSNTGLYWLLTTDETIVEGSQKTLEQLFEKSIKDTEVLANRVKISTPDPYINTLGSALSLAADGIWENPAYLHGAVAWRMFLNAWRGAYVADPLGWHDRAKTHFTSYSHSQVTEPLTGSVVFDAERNLARQKEELGTSMFSSGYISRNPNKNTVAHHYDMNLVFFDQMLRHFKWTGDTEFMKEMWPVIGRHLNWEKRNFDSDNDGLYDAYASIWASDALQYSGGGVIHSSAYNYYANKLVGEVAGKIQQDTLPYYKEADKILKAVNQKLWIPKKGIFAEFKDMLGNQLLHDSPGIWSIYHTIDSELSNPFESYQMLQYVDKQIPHIPISVDGLDKKDLYMISTTNWQPYTWSINNVALAEQLHTSLAFWQGGQSETAYTMWESALIESMYLGASPGGFEQLTYQDAMRGELYRDFADPIGMASRTLVEGLFGIQPDAMKGVLTIKPGFPEKWDNAALEIPDVSYFFKRENKNDVYHIENHFAKKMALKFIVAIPFEKIKSVTVNGKTATWTASAESIGSPQLTIEAPYSESYDIVISWDGKALEKIKTAKVYALGDSLNITTDKVSILKVYDPQSCLDAISKTDKTLTANAKGTANKCFFVQLKQGDLSWWSPVEFEVRPKMESRITALKNENLELAVKNNTSDEMVGKLVYASAKEKQAIHLNKKGEKTIQIPVQDLMPGTNSFCLRTASDSVYKISITNWDIPLSKEKSLETVSLSSFFNAKVTDVFKTEYLSPRPKTVTLQLPKQGIGNWCYPNLSVSVDDKGLREKAKPTGQITTPEGIVFQTPFDENQKNIVFTSMWDNFPKSVSVPLKGKASHLYLMVAGTTNPMQSRIVNGEIRVNYTDGTSEVLLLKNPENWWPIEQDYFTNGLAFTTDAPKPLRVYLKTGEISRTFKDFITIKGYTNYGIDGGAATILDLPLDNNKKLKDVTLKTIANDVVIGLMSATLVR
ncbi:DUF4450 domain-containing protein [Flavobacterium gilvum]|uniref:Glycogen debranching protein n=1 Tax=Flavobacterium gilvum TaxID=1492737 RepID=A0AAC9N7P1_9FLAO|nr:DUF4450 domain-containing protein [Flavobacterium gilvum]AOW10828.1 glycogen debranching protein [Flavobacterium gilvum]KFC59915.1 glycogen debranching enzyme [Flavobacterium gilvum]